MKPVTQVVPTTGTIKVAVVETDVLGVLAWHCKCLTCGWQSERKSRNATAVRHASAHRCTRWGSR